MVKEIAILTISIYQKYLSFALKILLGQPRFCYQSPSCSEYAKESIQEYGLVVGLIKALRRVFSCRPAFLI